MNIESFIKFNWKCIKKTSSNKSMLNFLMPPHPLTDYERQKYYQNEHKRWGIHNNS